MSNLPTLIVDVDPIDWLTLCRYTVRVDDLPTVQRDVVHNAIPADKQRRLLRVDDRCTLATETIVGGHEGDWQYATVPFATATVTNIEQEHDNKEPIFRSWIVTVSDVEPIT